MRVPAEECGVDGTGLSTAELRVPLQQPPRLGILASGVRGATQVRAKDGVHPDIVGRSSS
jgi:hypothetical protein